MSSSRGPHRPIGEGANLVLMQGRIPADLRDAAKVRARELGLSNAQYLEALVRYDLAENALTAISEPEFEQGKLTG